MKNFFIEPSYVPDTALTIKSRYSNFLLAIKYHIEIASENILDAGEYFRFIAPGEMSIMTFLDTPKNGEGVRRTAERIVQMFFPSGNPKAFLNGVIKTRSMPFLCFGNMDIDIIDVRALYNNLRTSPACNFLSRIPLPEPEDFNYPSDMGVSINKGMEYGIHGGVLNDYLHRGVLPSDFIQYAASSGRMFYGEYNEMLFSKPGEAFTFPPILFSPVSDNKHYRGQVTRTIPSIPEVWFNTVRPQFFRKYLKTNNVS